ncbi:MAG: FAD-binding oxidoreductase [Candidatus Brennerbacteria bacterium]|nr:FAD-binding oxidoreductase [Candidatus Brennerbacteria bacterium]
MMNDYINELKTFIKGEVLSDEQSLDHYSKDGSIFQMRPWAVILPSSKDDLISLVKWLAFKKNEIKEPGIKEKFSITCRGKATDQAGGPINTGLIVRFPKYLDKILEIGADFVKVEPGVIWGDLNRKLESEQGRFIPCYPASANFATLGGGVANNCAGEKSVKYGPMREYILSLKMILADGKEVEFKNLNSEEIAKKQAQRDSEGEIYRRISDLLIGNHNLIQNSRLNVNKMSSGYWLYDVLKENGDIDLPRLIAGSQGTLGIITEITLKTISKPKNTALLLVAFEDLIKAGQAVPRILKLEPSAFEMVDRFLIEMTQREKPEMVETLMKGRVQAPALVLLIEFDGDEENFLKIKIEEAKKIISDLTSDFREAYEKPIQDELWKVRRAAAIVAESAKGAKKALPFIEDSIVAPENLSEYLSKLYEIFKKYDVQFSVWGHAGNGNVHVQPFLDLSSPADVEKLLGIAKETYEAVISLKGALSGEHSDGLMRTPFLKESFGEPLYKLFEEVKNIFDPAGIFNPYKKVGIDWEFSKKYLRREYEIEISGST